jgi:N-acetylmuramoyl-L-alanine amidase
LIDLVRRQTGNLSIAFARNIVEQFAHEVVLRDHPRRSADFAVLTAPDVPSVLVELGCLSNPREAHLLQQHPYQQILARGLVRAVQAYFGHPAN